MAEVPMSVFQARLFPEGEYQKIEATTALKAAESLYGQPLSDTGGRHELRVMVHEMTWPRRPSAMLFYDRG
jgi:hypothetical protein